MQPALALTPLTWPKPLERVFETDREHCPHCDGKLKFIAAILESPANEKIPVRPPRGLTLPSPSAAL